MTESPLPATEPPPPAAEPPPPATGGTLIAGVTVIATIAALLDLFALLLLPLRIGGHLIGLGPVLVFAVNAALGYLGLRILQSRLPAQLVLAVAIVLSTIAAGRGPGGDVLVTRALQSVYLAFVVLAALGAAVPLFLPRKARPTPGRATGR